LTKTKKKTTAAVNARKAKKVAKAQESGGPREGSTTARDDRLSPGLLPLLVPNALATRHASHVVTIGAPILDATTSARDDIRKYFNPYTLGWDAKTPASQA
jgi:hypothetical protein